MRTFLQIFIVAALVLAFALPTAGKVKLVVTREVLVEYVKDRLKLLEGEEPLDEEQAAELNFIRQNRDNLQALADFYGMKIKEKTVPKISVPKEPPPSQEKSVKEILRSHPLTPKSVEWETASTKTSDPEEKSVGLMRNDEMAEAKSAERGEEKIAQKAIGADEGARSPVEISSPNVSDTYALNNMRVPGSVHETNKTDEIDQINQIDQTDQMNETDRTDEIDQTHQIDQTDEIDQINQIVAQPEQASLIATEEEVKQFFANYVERYTQKDTDGLLSLFSPMAVQNGRNDFDEIKEIYSDFFDESQELRYHIEDMRIAIYQNAVEARGRYEVNQILKKTGKKKSWKGHIRWILVRENGVLKIRLLDFTPQE